MSEIISTWSALSLCLGDTALRALFDNAVTQRNWLNMGKVMLFLAIATTWGPGGPWGGGSEARLRAEAPGDVRQNQGKGRGQHPLGVQRGPAGVGSLGPTVQASQER